MKLAPLQTDFTGGEVSPTVVGRADLSKYKQGAYRIQNFVVRPQGGIFKRMGTIDVGPIRDQTKTFRTVQFQPQLGSAYVLEFSDYQLRVWKYGVLVQFTTPTGGDNYTITTPWPVAEIYNITFNQDVDTLTIYHPTIQTQYLQRLSVGATENWTLAAYNFVSGPYLPVDTTGTLLTASNPVYMYKLQSNALFGSVTANTYIEYQQNNNWYLALVLGTGTSPAAPANPTANVIYVQPVSSIVRNIAQNAVMSYYAAAPSDPLYPTTYNELRSTVQVFSYTLQGSYIRWTDAITNINNWALISLYEGLRAYPNPQYQLTNPTVGQLQLGNTYQITAYTSGSITASSGYTFSALGNMFTMGAGYSVSSPVMTIKNYSQMLQYDCVQVNSPVTYTSISGSVTQTLYQNSATLTASSALWDTTSPTSMDTGRFVRMQLGNGTATTVVSMQITAVSSSTVATVSLLNSIPTVTNSTQLLDNGVSSVWSLGVFRLNSWPACGVIHEQRHVLAGAPLDPASSSFSETGKYNSFEPSNSQAQVLDTSSFTASITSPSLARIHWLATNITLIIGSEANENQVRPSYLNQTLSPTTFRITPDSTYGSLYRPEHVGAALVFVQRSGIKLKQYQYDYTVDGFNADDVNLIAEHILRSNGGVKDFAYQQNPHGILWFVMNNGTLCSLTYNKKENVFAWCRHTLGGGALVETLAITTSSDGTTDQVFFGVNRSGSRRIERMADDFNPTAATVFQEDGSLRTTLNATDQANMVYLDSAVYYAGPITTLTVDSRFTGQTIGIISDGAVQPDQVVSGTTVTLQRQSQSGVWIGFNYTALMESLPVVEQIRGETTAGEYKQISRIVARLYNTLDLQYARNESKPLVRENFASSSDTMDLPPPLFTGIRPLPTTIGVSRDNTFVVVSSRAYPCNILAISTEMSV